MAYSILADIVIASGGQTAYDQLFDFNGDGVADADALAQAQDYADGIINENLNRRFKIVTPSRTVQLLAAFEAVYYARQCKPTLGVTAEEVTQHEARMKRLAGMKEGDLVPDDPIPPPSSESNKAQIVENCSPMSRERSKGSIW